MSEMQKVYGLRLVVEDLINAPLLLSAKAVIRDSQISPDGRTVLLIIREPIEEEPKPRPPTRRPSYAATLRCGKCGAGRLAGRAEANAIVQLAFDQNGYTCAGCDGPSAEAE